MGGKHQPGHLQTLLTPVQPTPTLAASVLPRPPCAPTHVLPPWALPRRPSPAEECRALTQVLRVAFLEAAWSWEAGTQQRRLLLREAQQCQPGPRGCRSSLQDCAPGQTSQWCFLFLTTAPAPTVFLLAQPQEMASEVTTLPSPPRSALSSTDSLTSLGKSSTLTPRLLSRTPFPPTFLGELWDCVSLTSSVLSSAPRSLQGGGWGGQLVLVVKGLPAHISPTSQIPLQTPSKLHSNTSLPESSGA